MRLKLQTTLNSIVFTCFLSYHLCNDWNVTTSLSGSAELLFFPKSFSQNIFCCTSTHWCSIYSSISHSFFCSLYSSTPSASCFFYSVSYPLAISSSSEYADFYLFESWTSGRSPVSLIYFLSPQIWQIILHFGPSFFYNFDTRAKTGKLLWRRVHVEKLSYLKIKFK